MLFSHQVFEEHVGFGSTGNAFVKGFKREREANMLWFATLDSDHWTPISHKVFLESFCRSQFSHKSVN